jgi:FixJ family two-component response regulator
MKSNCMIAIVDDDLAIQEAMGDVLRSYGFRSLVFSSAEEFLAYEDRSTIDCILLDVKMPGLSGLQLFELLQTERDPSTIIFMTSHQEDNVRATALEGGARAFLGKPVDLDLLVALIEEIYSDR